MATRRHCRAVVNKALRLFFAGSFASALVTKAAASFVWKQAVIWHDLVTFYALL